MKVKELIDLLSQEDPNRRVVGLGYEGGYDDVEGVGSYDLAIGLHEEWYYGEHDIPELIRDDQKDVEIEPCVIVYCNRRD